MKSVLETGLRRRLRDELKPGTRILLAVSGGGDSMALLHLVDRCRKALRLEVHVAHLDHGLRRGSGADRKFVERTARDLGLPCHADRYEVDRLRRKDESIEEAARRLRRAYLQETATACGAEWILTAHTEDDQAETILMRWLRGGGPRALTGMSHRGPGPFLRPLLSSGGESLRQYLDKRELAYREDPSNSDERFDRNRIRRRVLPFLTEHVNRRAARNLVQSAQAIQADAEQLDRMARQTLEELWTSGPRGWAADSGALAKLDPPMRNRVWVLALQGAGADPRRIRRSHLEALEDLLAGGRNRRADLPGGIAAWKDSRRRLRIRRGTPD